MDNILYFVVRASHVKLLVQQLSSAAVRLLKARSASDLEETANHLQMIVATIREEARRHRVRTVAFMGGDETYECEFHFTAYRAECGDCFKARREKRRAEEAAL